MAPAEAARVVAAVAGALQAAHLAGVVHRDVKPGNVFLTSGGEVKVLDFGIASAAGETDLTTGVMLGTAAYLAPERALGQPATPAADVYSLGVVLYELLAGRRPFEGGSDVELAMAHVNARPAPLGLVAPSTPPFLVSACEQALAKDPAARPRSAAAFTRLLRSPAAAPPATRPLPVAAVAPVTRPLPVAAVPPLTRPVRPRLRRRGLLVALLLAVTALAALPALAGGLVPWAGERPEAPFAVPVPDTTTPTPADRPTTQPNADQPDPSAGTDRPPGADRRDRADDDRDRADGDSSGPGRSGGDDSGGGDSSGPG
jgi:eukaryotic-like serine/threonine-protein kinase